MDRRTHSRARNLIIWIDIAMITAIGKKDIESIRNLNNTRRFIIKSIKGGFYK